MPQPRAVKEKVVQDLTTSLAEADSVYIADLTGLNVEQVTRLRSQLRAESTQCKVVKNTLTRFAVQNAELPDLGDFLEGPTALIISQDPVAPAKILVDFGKENNDLPRIKGGLLTGELIETSQVEQLAKLPSRDELLAKVVGGIAAPISGLVFCLSGMAGNLVRALAAVAAQKEAGVEPVPADAAKAVSEETEEVETPAEVATENAEAESVIEEASAEVEAEVATENAGTESSVASADEASSAETPAESEDASKEEDKKDKE